jgi:hypothetical protein
MEYDPALSHPAIIMFGGFNSTGVLQDTWRLPNTGNWMICPSTVCVKPPQKRCCVGMAFDQRNNILVIFGGGNTAGLPEGANSRIYFSDTWEFSDASPWVCVDGGLGGCSPP